MAGGSRKLRAPVPIHYSRIRVPRQTIIARIEAGQLLRAGRRDAADASVYEKRGLIVV